MDSDLSPSASAGRFPRLLIADQDFSTIESLMRTFGDMQLDFEYDLCTSHANAVMRLSRFPSPYQLIISSARLTEIDDFLLLKHNHNHQPFVPFVVTSGASDSESARRALEEGAFDFIPTPLEHEQPGNTIRLALWFNKFKALIASRDRALEKNRQHIADYPGDRNGDDAFHRALSSVEKTISQVERSVLAIETSTASLSDFAAEVKHQTRKRALERLDGAKLVPKHPDTP